MKIVWNDVRDRLPQQLSRDYRNNMRTVPYIVYNGDNVMVAAYSERGFRYLHNHNIIKPEVTHWTYLPDPPMIRYAVYFKKNGKKGVFIVKGNSIENIRNIINIELKRKGLDEDKNLVYSIKLSGS